MLDTDLARLISPLLGQHFGEARDCISMFPSHALAKLRTCAHYMCACLAEGTPAQRPLTGSLDRKIYLLIQNGIITAETENHLQVLRINGNKGVHPEQFNLERPQLTELATQSLDAAHALLLACHKKQFPEADAPALDDAADTPANLKELIFQATIERRPDAQHLAGKILLSRMDTARDGTVDNWTQYFENQAVWNSYREQAALWLKQAAAESHIPSMYEYGLMLIAGHEGDAKIGTGEIYIHQAAGQGHADANNVLANFYLHGSRSFERDLREARKYFEIAAAEDHPSALAQLGALYEKGLGGPADSAAAFECTRKSAEAGFPQGQYNLFIYLWNQAGGQERAAALDWLEKSAAQSFPQAMLMLAHLTATGQLPQRAVDTAEPWYERCLGFEHTANIACLELAQLYQALGLDAPRLLRAVLLLQQCYEKENGETALALECREMAPPLVARLRDSIAEFAHDNELLLSAIRASNRFDPHGHPYLNSADRDRLLANKVKEFPELPTRAARHRKQLQDFLSGIKLPARSFKSRSQGAPGELAPRKLGRNEKCLCNSGMKFKNCCGR